MSGWSTRKEAERVIRETVKRVDPLKTGLSNDPRDYWMQRLYDHVLVGSSRHGWGIVSHDEDWFHIAMSRHQRSDHRKMTR